ncbi:MAG: putative toxin-antitoxin system toxin component, PIN family [Azoarcus sp.]|nr:putative toxin-antitoxin system toxin component, PIN family [Azoarcus sp.]
MSAPMRAVLDTNTVMALWWWQDPKLAPLARAIETGTFALAAREDTLGELTRVLAYRQFAIPAARQAEIAEAYRSRCTLSPPPSSDAAPLPECRDRDDQKFLELTRDSGATLLVSRDKVLLRLDRHRLVRSLYRIRTPEAVCAELETR